MTDTIFNVDATALFYTAPAPDYMTLLDALNVAFADTPGCYLTKSPLSHDTWWLLSCEQFHIMIGFEDQPAPMARFAQAVTSPINRLNRFGYDHAVQNHNLHLNIEIGDGNAPLPPEARKIMQEFGTGTHCDPALKIKALHITAQFIAQHAGFLALHFAPSDRLLSAEDLQATRGHDMPVDLLLHPVPTEVNLDAHGRETWALRLKNPQHLPGPAIEIEGIPRAVPLATAVNLLRTLNRAHGAGKLALKEGDTISPTGKWALHVFRVAGDTAMPQGRIVLSFYKDRVAETDQPVAEAARPTATTVETAPQHGTEGFAAKALAALRKGGEAAGPKQSAKNAAPAPAMRAETKPQTQSAASPLPEELHPVSGTAPAKAAHTEIDAAPNTAKTPRKERVSLLGWMVEHCKTLPKESSATVTSLALIVALTTLANPYAGFTGGHDVQPVAQAGIASLSAPANTFAALIP